MAVKQYKINPKQYWPSIDAIYRARMNAFLALASRHVFNKDHAIDAVQDAMVKSVEYFKDKPDRKIREQIIRWQVLKACKRINKYSKEIPYGLFREDYSETDE